MAPALLPWSMRPCVDDFPSGPNLRIGAAVPLALTVCATGRTRGRAGPEGYGHGAATASGSVESHGPGRRAGVRTERSQAQTALGSQAGVRVAVITVFSSQQFSGSRRVNPPEPHLCI